MFRTAHSFITCLSLCLVTQLALGASAAEEKQRLSALQQSLKIKQEALSEMQAELEIYPAKLSATEDDLAKAEQELEAGHQEIADLKHQASRDPAAAERELALKQHAVRMSERRVRSETRMLERYRRGVESLREDLANAEQDIAELRQRISDQSQRVATAEIVADRPAATISAPPPAPVVEPKAVGPKTPPQPAPVPASEAEVASETETSDATKTETATAETVGLSEHDAYALEIAREHKALLDELALEEDPASPQFFALSISGKEVETAPFEYISHNLYRAESKVQSGRSWVKINRAIFRLDIPEADDGEVYLFFVDATRPSRLHLTYYRKSLLNLL